MLWSGQPPDDWSGRVVNAGERKRKSKSDDSSHHNVNGKSSAGGGGGVKERAKEFNNVVNPPLVTCQDGAEDKMILGEVVFFPEHHVRIEFFVGHLKQTN